MVGKLMTKEKANADEKLARMKRSNEELLKDVEELTDENTKLLAKVKLLVGEESKLRDQIRACSKTEDDLRAELTMVKEARDNTKTTPEKDSRFESALRHIDSSSINPCPNCDSLRDEVKDLTRKLGLSRKELEMMGIRNEELLKQIRMMALSEHSRADNYEPTVVNQSLSNGANRTYLQQTPQPGSNIKPLQNIENFPSSFRYANSNDRNEELSFRTPIQAAGNKANDTTANGVNPLKADLAETLRSLKESKNKLENFQFKMKQQKEEIEVFNTPMSSASKQYPTRNKQDGYDVSESKGGLSNLLANPDPINFLGSLATKQLDSSLPQRKDFSLPRTSDLSHKLNALLGGEVSEKANNSMRDEQPSSVFSYFRGNYTDGFLKDDSAMSSKGFERAKDTASSRLKEPFLFKELESLEKFSKDDFSKFRPRRDERLLSALDDRIKADRSVDFGSKNYNKYIVPKDEAPAQGLDKKQRKSIGHAPQSRYLERLSRLYDGTEDQGLASMAQDYSLVSTRRQSASHDRSALAANDVFLKQINDRISSLVTK